MTEKKENLFEEKQERREFFKTLGKAALPAIALLGFGAMGSKLHGGQKAENINSKQPMDCDSGCSGGCEGSCKGDCSGGCSNTCDSTCRGGCDTGCKGGCDSGCKGGCGVSCSSQTK